MHVIGRGGRKEERRRNKKKEKKEEGKEIDQSGSGEFQHTQGTSESFRRVALRSWNPEGFFQPKTCRTNKY